MPTPPLHPAEVDEILSGRSSLRADALALRDAVGRLGDAVTRLGTAIDRLRGVLAEIERLPGRPAAQAHDGGIGRRG